MSQSSSVVPVLFRFLRKQNIPIIVCPTFGSKTHIDAYYPGTINNLVHLPLVCDKITTLTRPLRIHCTWKGIPEIGTAEYEHLYKALSVLRKEKGWSAVRIVANISKKMTEQRLSGLLPAPALKVEHINF